MQKEIKMNKILIILTILISIFCLTDFVVTYIGTTTYGIQYEGNLNTRYLIESYGYLGWLGLKIGIIIGISLLTYFCTKLDFNFIYNSVKIFVLIIYLLFLMNFVYATYGWLPILGVM